MSMFRASRGTLIAVSVAATFLLAACTTTATPPLPAGPPTPTVQTQPPEPPKQQPAAEVSGTSIPPDALPTNQPDCDPTGTNFPRLYVSNNGWPGTSAGLCTGFVDTEPVEVDVLLPTGTTAAQARESLTILAPQQPTWRYDDRAREPTVTLQFPAGVEGERILVRLRGTFDGKEQDLALLLQRAEMRISVDVRISEGTWRPLRQGETLPAAPVTLRFGFTGGIAAAEIDSRIRSALRRVSDYTLQRAGDDGFVLALPTPPPRLFFDFHGITARPNWQVRHSRFVAYTGEEPRLVRINVETGVEEAGAQLPTDISWSSLSPDGRSAALHITNLDFQTDHDYVLDLQTGRLSRLPFSLYDWHPQAAWMGDRVVFPERNNLRIWDLQASKLTEQASPGDLWTVSPGGRYLVGSSVDLSKQASGGDQFAPASVIVVDLQTLQERAHPGVVRSFQPGRDSITFWMPYRWDGPDGMLVINHTGNDPNAGDVLRIDLASGEVRSTGAHGFPNDSGPDGWSTGPSGARFLPNVWGPVRWQPASGAEKTFGEGLALGMTDARTLLVVRWPNAPNRRMPDTGL